MNPWVVSISIAYLLGSIPFGYLLVRIFRKQDIRAQGSGNIGATNVARSGAKGLGLATLLLDLGKGYAAVAIARQIASHLAASSILVGGADAGPGTAIATGMAHHLGAGLGGPVYDLEVAAAVAAVVGHVFPVWLGFKGGKGVATALGVFLALTWPSALAGLVVFAVVFGLTRYVSLASLAGALTLPLFGFYFVTVRTPWVVFGFLFIPLLVIVKHHGNIRRLMSGTESRFGTKAKPGASSGQTGAGPGTGPVDARGKAGA
jgi:glycerol-3-phosphate acyltransferase PlsY